MLRMTTSAMVASLALLAMLLAGCSGEVDAGVASLAADDVVAAEDGDAGAVDAQEAMLAFAACMREQGLDFADPVQDEEGNLRFGPPGGGGGGGNGGFDPEQREVMQAAREECGGLLEGLELAGRGGRGPGQGEFDADAFLAFAECMRENGVEDFPDPGADGRPNVEAMQGLDRSSEEFQSASETCADESGFAGPMGGGRGGFGGPGGGRGGPGGQA